MLRIAFVKLTIIFLVVSAFSQLPMKGLTNDLVEPSNALFVPGKMALKFDSSSVQTDNRGHFWRAGVAYNQPFFFSANVFPTGNAQYIISAGNGGLHNLLFGFTSCNETTNRTTLTGNVGTYPQNAVPVKDWQSRIPELMEHPKYAIGKKGSRSAEGEIYQEFSALDSSAVSQTTFGSTDEILCNEWVNVSVGYDGVGSIGVWINGLPSARFPFDGKRMALYPFETVLFIGGSDHSMFNGFIRNAVFYEGSFPLDSVTRSFFPERNFQSVVVGYDGQRLKSSLLVNYTEGTLLDYSSGFEGVMHPGRLSRNGAQLVDPGLFGVRKSHEDIADRLYFFDFVVPSGVPPPNTAPLGALIFDSFSRPNTNASGRLFAGLGATEVGNRQWQNSLHTRVINGQVGATADYQTFFFDSGNTTGKACARRGHSPFPNNSYYQINVKVHNNLTKIGLESDPYQVARFLKYEGTQYAPTVLGAVVRPAMWSKVCVEYTESTLKASFDDGPVILEAIVPPSFAEYKGVGLTMYSAPSVGTRWDWISVSSN